MNLLFISTITVCALTVAILMNEAYRSRMSKYYQTMLFFPYFISWVIVSYFVFAFLNGQTGLINQWIDALGIKRIAWYRSPEFWPVILTMANLWNGIGFSSIIYLAGILGISPSFSKPRRSTGRASCNRSAILHCRCCIR